ncbi:hypothetical protein JHL17_11350 [Azospirillum sp. YIM B02556]|uniref:Uncharacterized protein n=1 Tax=Azospirillum endophyticum TaxID=2800326 RepID=A0ABS1F3S5_9PROT|nr:hypothetical protein [Azospirillum endophyticum]MBK1838009.1 hypothetical protein [Azospirillum endophyticum]
MTARAAWRRWSAVRIELAELLTREQLASIGRPVVIGRMRYSSPAELETLQAPGWTAISLEAAQRFQAMVNAKATRLRGGKPGREMSGTAPWRVRRLEQEARRLAAEIRARPVTGAADVLARLDVIAAMWGPDGTITEPGAPLAEVLALLDELSRSVPGFTATWRRCRRAGEAAEAKTGSAATG